MKKIINILAIILLFVGSISAQCTFFRGNITNQKMVGQDRNSIEQINGDLQISFDFSSMRLQFDSYDVEYAEDIVDTEWINNTRLVWTETSYYQIYYNSNRNRIVYLIEFPLIGEVEYRQYYYKTPPKPQMSNN